MNILIDIVNWILVYWLLPLLPINLPGVSFETYIALLNNVKGILVFIFSILNNFVSIQLFLGFVILVLSAEIILFIFKMTNWLINIVRGSGA